MKFICDQCKTRYTIADEKVHGKVLKIRCKNCGNVIEVREPGARPGASAARKASGAQGARRTGRRSTSQVARLRSSTGQKLVPSTGDRKRAPSKTKRSAGGRLSAGARATKRPSELGARHSTKRADPGIAEEREEKTVIASMPDELLRQAMQKSKAQRVSALRGGSRRRPPTKPEPAVWYLGDDRGEYGPMTFSELAARVKRGEPGANAEAWKEGMDDWLPLSDIPDLVPFLKKAPPPRPTGGFRAAAPPSPLQKRPGKDAVEKIAPAPKATPIAEDVSEPIVKAAAPVPAAATASPAPQAALSSVPGAVPARPGVPAAPGVPAGPAVAEASGAMAVVTGGTPAPASQPVLPAFGGGVGQAGPSDLGMLLAQEQRKARRPVLIISLVAVAIAALAVVLVIYLLSSGKKRGSGESHPEVAARDPGMSPRSGSRHARSGAAAPMRARPGDDGAGEAQELPELDIDVSDSRPAPRVGRRHAGVPHGARRSSARRSASRVSARGTRDPLSVPAFHPMFTGLMGFGSPRSSSTAGFSSGSRPGDLGSVVRRNYGRLKRCYEKASRLNSRLRNPRLRITIRVRPSGKVYGVSVSPGRYAGATLGICIRRSIMSWHFPTFSANYNYAFSARFHSG